MVVVSELESSYLSDTSFNPNPLLIPKQGGVPEPNLEQAHSKYCRVMV